MPNGTATFRFCSHRAEHQSGRHTLAVGARRGPELREAGAARHGAGLSDRQLRTYRTREVHRSSGWGGGVRGTTSWGVELLRGRLDRLGEQLDSHPELKNRRFPELACASPGGRRLLLKGATLLHVAAEYGSVECAELLLGRGAAVNARAEIDAAGIGGQTAIFHSVTQFGDYGLAVTRVLLEAGADLSLRVKLPGHYERAEEVVECTPLGTRCASGLGTAEREDEFGC